MNANRETAMQDALEDLIRAARLIEPSDEQKELQRRSFAYGNTKFENQLITREMVDRQAEKLKRDDSSGGDDRSGRD